MSQLIANPLGMAKAWVRCNKDGVINDSLNISSISDSGTGRVGIYIDVDFSSSSYVPVATVISVDAHFCYVMNSIGSGFLEVRCVNDIGSPVDPSVGYAVAMFGRR